MKLILTLIVLAAVLFGVWRWAVATGSAATLDWIDARFGRTTQVEMVASGQYGTDTEQRAEIWAPTGVQNPPLVAFIHGGGWHSGAPQDYRFITRTLGDMGYATALVGYRLVPEGRFPAMLEDSAAGVAWAVKLADKQGIAADSVVLMGHSAGAYNAVMLALDPQWLKAAGSAPDVVSGAIGLSGPYDFYPFTSDSSRNAFGHVTPPASTQPIAFVSGEAPPLLLVHGTADTVVRIRNSRRLDTAIREAGGSSQIVEVKDRGHAWPVMALARPFDRDTQVGAAVRAFLQERLTRASLAVQSEVR